MRPSSSLHACFGAKHRARPQLIEFLELGLSWNDHVQVKMTSWHGHNALVIECCAHPFFFLPCSFEFANSQTIQQLELKSIQLTASLVIDGAYVTSTALS